MTTPTRHLRPKLALLAALLMATAAHAQEPSGNAEIQRGQIAHGQIEHGQRVFLYCAACHNLQLGQTAKVGPVLAGVVGAHAAARGDYDYSQALRQSGLIWTEDNLDKWLTQPAALVPGTKMAFIGLPKAADRQAVIAYLRQAGK